MYQVNEIFSSLQGEGFNTGRKMVFIRLAKCNLACAWCDTKFDGYIEMNLASILRKVNSYGLGNVLITGGEPTIHKGFEELVVSLKKEGYKVFLETNGLKAMSRKVEDFIDYVAVSPKACYASLYEKDNILDFADEVRVVVDGDVQIFCEYIEEKIVAARYYLSPCYKNDEFNFLETIKLLGELNERSIGQKWGLSIQSHKFAKIQ